MAILGVKTVIFAQIVGQNSLFLIKSGNFFDHEFCDLSMIFGINCLIFQPQRNLGELALGPILSRKGKKMLILVITT
jgi:hypothetical protein